MNSENTLFYRWLGVLRCPQCREKLALEVDDQIGRLRCSECAANYAVLNGVPRLIMPSRVERIKAFCEKYDALRVREGWASEVPEFYQHLPFQDLSGRHPQEWRWRAQSFCFLQNWLAKNFKNRMARILDLGAGSGWMSWHLAERHEVLAVDVNVGPHGLSALSNLPRRFLAVQAESEHLPLASHVFDVAVANASWHYVKNPEKTFEKIAEVLRPGGKLIVMDSPTYPSRLAALAAHERTQAYYTEMGVPELAQNYAGLVGDIFSKQQDFRFTRWRRDFSTAALFKKWLREKMGSPAAARFPIWVGERLPRPEEKWQPGRQRAGALIIHNRKLLTYHWRNERKEYWRIPGGGIEPDETPEQAARRELHEELGLPIVIRRQFGPYFRSDKNEWYFLAETNPEKLPADHSEAPEHPCKVRWLPVEKLADYEIRPPALKWELVEYFHRKT
ncbi:MAG: NUDIX domain-containing protein [candidate division KSB1 bacterium]|nr:NUDIX domain-containing protein [candidate division KSB1 bacterium]MDZ7365882.1 NUDIX domain-containing protein [candidate division KSB1 bacterium]MDZ7403883.1 NUDIX domain-containing protein [candidate division KSB1 bacterium]